ncbi:MAG: PAS domain-containing protein, partial [Thermodesulfobacteriota bacterium]
MKQDRNHVLFLNDLRHRPLSALSLSIPVSRDELPAVQAVSGKTGMFMGKDYREVEVLADLRPISGTSWFMVTKVDTSEILKEASYRGAVVAMFVAFSLLLFSSLAALWIRHGRARLWKRLYTSERELRLAQEVFRTILYSIGDAVIATDTRGKVTIMNPVAEALTGWSEQEATGQDLQELFRIVNEESRLPVENPVARVLREGLAVGLANDTLLVSRDGTERPIADSGAPIRDEKGEISGVVLVFRDQTRERALARELERSRRDWHQIFETAGNP